MRYKAFISYSHTADSQLAPALRGMLQRLGRPWYRPFGLRVFRDETNLCANPALWSSIEAALADSEWFILMASPAASASQWVRRELQWWLNHRSAERILIVVTAGQVNWNDFAGDFDWSKTDALPRILSHHFEEEPLYVDLSGCNADHAQNFSRSPMRKHVVRIAAALLNRSPDEIESEDMRQYRRNCAWAAVAGTCIAVSATLAIWQHEKAKILAREQEQLRRFSDLVGEKLTLAEAEKLQCLKSYCQQPPVAGTATPHIAQMPLTGGASINEGTRLAKR